jgi:hypothetical protein
MEDLDVLQEAHRSLGIQLFRYSQTLVALGRRRYPGHFSNWATVESWQPTIESARATIFEEVAQKYGPSIQEFGVVMPTKDIVASIAEGTLTRSNLNQSAQGHLVDGLAREAGQPFDGLAGLTTRCSRSLWMARNSSTTPLLKPEVSRFVRQFVDFLEVHVGEIAVYGNRDAAKSALIGEPVEGLYGRLSKTLMNAIEPIFVPDPPLSSAVERRIPNTRSTVELDR